MRPEIIYFTRKGKLDQKELDKALKAEREIDRVMFPITEDLQHGWHTISVVQDRNLPVYQELGEAIRMSATALKHGGLALASQYKGRHGNIWTVVVGRVKGADLRKTRI
jgi:hypothetical protein